jgi:hypothetical protein
MALFTEDILRKRYYRYSEVPISADVELKPAFKEVMYRWLNSKPLYHNDGTDIFYDIFLSHSSKDAVLVISLASVIEDLGFTVFIDWREAHLVNRDNISKETALILRECMRHCKSFVYTFSENAPASKWMPWELGYFDGINGKVAILPIVKTNKASYLGTEYLGIYEYIQISVDEDWEKCKLLVHSTESNYLSFENWLNTAKTIRRLR